MLWDERADGRLTSRARAAGVVQTASLVMGRPTVRLPLAAIVVSASATRRDMGDLAGLAQTLEEHGLLQPVVVRLEGAQYVLVCGERRLNVSRRSAWGSYLSASARS